MKRILSIIFIIGVMMTCLTSCGGPDFDGKWSCVEAEVDTHGGVLDNAYDAIGQNLGVGVLCEIEIDDDDVTYSENLTEFKVTDVEYDGSKLYLSLKGRLGVESVAVLKYDEDEDTIIVSRENNKYTLERSDFIHKVVLGLPWWAYFILIAAIVFLIIGKRAAAKNARNNKNIPQFNNSNSNIPQFAPRQMPSGGQPSNPVQSAQPAKPAQSAQNIQQPRQDAPTDSDPKNPFQN